jgi:hypothetical protein
MVVPIAMASVMNLPTLCSYTGNTLVSELRWNGIVVFDKFLRDQLNFSTWIVDYLNTWWVYSLLGQKQFGLECRRFGGRNSQGDLRVPGLMDKFRNCTTLAGLEGTNGVTKY